ncbi:MAG: hypothetical protein K2F53_01705 [Rikenellaceae bacterium]|nr:hypothetical protein [Rikenellaceae bacterium]
MTGTAPALTVASAMFGATTALRHSPDTHLLYVMMVRHDGMSHERNGGRQQ